MKQATPNPLGYSRLVAKAADFDPSSHIFDMLFERHLLMMCDCGVQRNVNRTALWSNLTPPSILDGGPAKNSIHNNMMDSECLFIYKSSHETL
jgi:hypothetical protein